MKQKVSVIIAAYNEEPRIAKVLSVVENHPLVDEVIVVNDGSKDKTSEVVKKYKVTLIENEKNLGKTLSVKRGIEKARNDIVLMLDADLVGLTSKSINALVIPVINGKVDWTLSLRGNSFGYMKKMGIDWVSGERAIRKELLKDPFIWSKPKVGFGLETLMNKSFIDRGATFQSIYLPNLRVVNKADKIGLVKGWYCEIKMVRQISRVLPLYKVIAQFITMAKLNKRYKSSLSLEQQPNEA
ncbi:MAG: glycosyltransferase family 2 protein [Patescibacteria group bacterium]|jgi:glycosyltransferase involved in cell wall biosynthesis|nr:glycosyltransferase family 2 protein [Patescibacteria group bacterium]